MCFRLNLMQSALCVIQFSAPLTGLHRSSWVVSTELSRSKSVNIPRSVMATLLRIGLSFVVKIVPILPTLLKNAPKRGHEHCSGVCCCVWFLIWAELLFRNLALHSIYPWIVFNYRSNHTYSQRNAISLFSDRHSCSQHKLWRRSQETEEVRRRLRVCRWRGSYQIIPW